MSDDVLHVKRTLESAFDIPFSVIEHYEQGRSGMLIAPDYEGQQYFEIKVLIKNNLRMRLEVHPEKYSAFSAADMAKASLEKKDLFARYAALIKAKGASTEFIINGLPVDLCRPESWPSEWNNYLCRISKFPIIDEDEVFNRAEVIGKWALLAAGMFLSLLDIVSVSETAKPVLEGGAKQVTTNIYERNPINRELCLAANGYKCAICGFDFEKTYGPIGQAKDMIPVCPNCHAMLHRKDPPLTPEELKATLYKDN